MELQPIATPDLSALHRLNQAHAVELSSLSLSRFAELAGRAFYAKALPPDAFLLAFDESADYDSPNFLWFRERYDRFVYVDRIVVGQARRGEGLARRFYDDLFAEARAKGHTRIVAEVNSDPPNPASDAFHAALGFKVAGEAHLADRGKSVRYLLRDL